MTENALALHVFGDNDPALLAKAARVARNARAALPPGTRIHIILQGLVVATVATVANDDHLSEVRDDPDTSIAACANSLRSADLTPAELTTGVDTVDAAVAELARLQWAGAAYVRL